jgi:retinol dehydrogenase-14
MSTWHVSGKTILITGATSGIGLEASVSLARSGARVVIVGRDVKKTEACVQDIERRSGARGVESLLCDFSSQRSIRALADAVRAKYDHLDVLINNAGGVWAERTLTEDGIEATFAVNHLGYVLLTRLLLDLVTKTGHGRIVNTSSRGHYRGTMDFDDLGYAKGYFIMRAYCRSKLGNVLFTRELSRRLQGTGVTVTCLHPGAVATNIWSSAPRWSRPLLNLFARPFFISAEKGGQTIVHLAASPDVEGITGEYFSDNRVKTPSALARDVALAARLWEVSARLVGLPA